MDITTYRFLPGDALTGFYCHHPDFLLGVCMYFVLSNCLGCCKMLNNMSCDMISIYSAKHHLVRFTAFGGIWAAVSRHWLQTLAQWATFMWWRRHRVQGHRVRWVSQAVLFFLFGVKFSSEFFLLLWRHTFYLPQWKWMMREWTTPDPVCCTLNVFTLSKPSS